AGSFVRLMPYETRLALLPPLGAMAALLLAIGWRDRIAACAALLVVASLCARGSSMGSTSLVWLGGLLLAHIAIPVAPYGSWSARGRVDPDGGWRMPDALFATAWIVIALAYGLGGWLSLINETPDTRGIAGRAAVGLALAYPLLAPFRRLRPWIWIAMLAVHGARLWLLQGPGYPPGLTMLHLFTFDPAWVKPRVTAGRDRMFYDGGCALCHGLVRFVLAEDRAAAFDFGPLQGSTFAAALPPATRTALPDSVVVRTERGDLLTRSEATLYILGRLGGLWRIIATLARVVPPALRDAVYDLVARTRHSVFGRVEDRCPVTPAALRSRFLD
ncbi:MAG TPA: DCC1-like thiol-disulfide oxidoreductase family protein, partial [Candidatus Polarisedimenticolia bacterium]|nr:DCC1-like thiol-disulfide oxidoreductase family protein [Candidatus Polarisedimenticolia bacterium]